MCTHTHYIYNRFKKESILVPCGKCEACKQQKALLRTNRIRLHQPEGFIFLFITLTYSNDYVPYILKSELNGDSSEVNIYRNCSGRYIFSSSNGLRFKKEAGISIVSCSPVDFAFRGDFDVNHLKPLKGLGSDKVGVCYYPDLQNFFKRLRINYEREFGKKPVFDYFCCSEFGGYTFRPHFHGLLSIPASDEAAFRRHIVQAWPYADSRRTAKFIEIARDAASYVASYVNSGVSLSSCLSCDAFKPKHSQSQNLGVVLECFSLRSLLAKVEQRDLHYYRAKKFDGNTAVMPLLVPKYIINRYFPLFKGISRFASSTLYDILISPQTVFKYLGDWQEKLRIESFVERCRYDDIIFYSRSDISCTYDVVSKLDFPNSAYTFSRNEVYQIGIRLYNAQLRFIEETGLNAYDFAFYYIAIWHLYHSTLLADSYNDIERIEDFSEFYFNSNDLVHGLVYAPTLVDVEINGDYNSFEDVIFKSSNLTKTYFLKDKTKKIVNYSMSELGYNV